MKIKIKGKEYDAHYSIRAQMLWEVTYERPFEPKTSDEIWIYYYCILVACNLDKNLERELPMTDFLDAVEEDSTIIASLVEAIAPPSLVKKKSLITRFKEKISSLIQLS